MLHIEQKAMAYHAFMPEDPKNPNAWWAVQKLPLSEMWPKKLSKQQKMRLIWLIPLFLLMVSVEIFYMIKLMR